MNGIPGRTLIGFVVVLLVPPSLLYATESHLRDVIRIKSGLLRGVINAERDVAAFKGIPRRLIQVS